MTATTGARREDLAALVQAASDGEVRADDLDGTTSLSAAGLGSLGLLRLLDAVEDRYDLELPASAAFDTLDELAALVDPDAGPR